MHEEQENAIGSGVSDVDTLERHYRVTLDFRVLVRAINDEVLRESFFFNARGASAKEPGFRERIERQVRLYRLLRADQPILEQYLLSVLMQEAGNFVYEGLANAFDAADEDELLVGLYQGMAEEDASYFEECREISALAENTDLISTAFKVEWVGAEVLETGLKVAGDVRKAEAIERAKTRLLKQLRPRH